MGKDRKKRGRTVWLVTWEHTGEHARPRARIAAILSPRYSPERVAKIVELLHANEIYTYSERLQLAVGRSPYPVQWDEIGGVRWTGRMTCGHNPYLEARVVDEFVVEEDDAGEERLSWKEREKPRLPGG